MPMTRAGTFTIITRTGEQKAIMTQHDFAVTVDTVTVTETIIVGADDSVHTE